MRIAKILLIIVLVLAAVLVIGYFFRDKLFQVAFAPTQQTEPTGITVPEPGPAVEIIAENLAIPWDLAFLPSGEILVTERPGRLLKIGTDKQVIPIDGVAHTGEGGLLGLALHPDFKNNNFLYLYLTTRAADGLINRVERYQLIGTELSDRTIIIDNIPGASIHDGGKIAFGPDGLLYITTGDAGREEQAQDLDSLAGKILRLTDEGAIPDSNPFGTAVYSYGHRNPQGLAWDDSGLLWATEHGRSGLQSGLDELNFIQAGKNYGWSVIQGGETNLQMLPPVVNSGSNVTWAPAGAAYVNGSIFFGGLRGESLYQAKINQRKVSVIAHFFKTYGRIRAVVLGPDGYLYITTSNQDGRGQVQAGDDKIIKINPSIFK